MSALNLAGGSGGGAGTGPGGGAGTGPGPSGPTNPAPTKALPLQPPAPSFDGHLPRFAEGRHRLVGAVHPLERPFPGAPAAGGDDPPRPGHPGPPPTPPFPPPPTS